VVAFVARYSALAVRATAAAFRQGGPAHEESAQASGAGYLRRLSRVVVPIHARGIGAAFVLVLVFCLRDLDLAAMLRPPGGDPLAVRILTLEPNGPPRVVAALSVLHASIVAVLLAAGGALFPRART
jgi:iron(III) transport system permease protein